MKLKQFYLSWFVFVYALYCYFNKGIAYTYLAEITWLFGGLIFLRDYRNILISWDRKMKVLLAFLLIVIVYMFRGIRQYPIMDVIRDSFMFNYIWFVVIVFLYRNELALFKSKIAQVYKWFPLIVTISFLLKSYIPYLAELSLFGRIPFLTYKYGDLGVHLLIASFFLMNGHTKISSRFAGLNFVLIGYLFLLTATYNRGGMLSYISGLAIFLYFSRKTDLAQKYFSYMKMIPVIFIIALPVYLNTKLNDKDLGRKIGIEQLTQNVTSLVNTNVEKADLNQNVFWRLAWWGKIIDYTVMGPYFLNGKGLGVNLAVDDGIDMEDDSLRSPHSFHLNVLARFGVPIFLLWLYWIFLLISGVRRKKLGSEDLMYLCIIIAFIINSSFDVSLEGPMSAFPCWTFVGLAFASEVENKEEVAHV